MKKHLLTWLWLGMLPAFNLWAAAGAVWLDPATAVVALNTAFGLKLLVDSGTLKLGTYNVKLTYDATKLQVDATTPVVAVLPASGGLDNTVINTSTAGTLVVAGFDAQGVGPGAALPVFTANFKCLGVTGSVPVGLNVVSLTTEGGATIGIPKGTGSMVTCGSAPDFAITAVTVAPATAVVNGTVTATVTVKNQGTGAGDGKLLSVWAHNAATPACAAAGWGKQVAVGALTAGQVKAIAVAGIPVGAIAGTKRLVAFVDSACATAETNETNNQKDVIYNVNKAAPAADLVVTGITLAPAAAAVNGVFTANVTVKNQGTVASLATSMVNVWNHSTTVMYCGAVATKSVGIGAALAAGTSKVVAVTGIPAGAVAGMKWLRAYADGTCITHETNEANNQLVVAYAINAPAPAAELSIVSVALSPVNPAVGTTYSATVTVKNTGTAGVGGNLEVWTHNPGIQQYCGAVGNARQAVANVGTNLTVTKTFTGLVAGAGATNTRTFRAYVDSACVTKETNEFNNQLTKLY